MRAPHGNSPARPLLFTLVAAMLLVVGVVMWVAWRVSLSPTVTRNFTDELNASLRAEPADSARTLIHRAIPATADRPTYPDDRGRPQLVTGDERPGEPGYDDLIAWLETDHAREALALWREAAAKPRLGAILRTDFDPELADAFELAGRPVSRPARAAPDNPAMVGVLLPYLAELRSAARLLRADARHAASLGDARRAIDDINAIAGLTRLACDQPVMISSLVGIALQLVTTEAARDVLHLAAPELDDHALVRLDAALARAEDAIDPARAFEGERAMLLDGLQRTYTDDGRGDGVMTTLGAALLRKGLWADDSGQPPTLVERFAALPAALSAPSRAELAESMERARRDALALVQLPLWQHDDSPHGATLASAAEHDDALLATIIPAYDRFVSQVRIGRLHVRAARVVIALHRYRAAHADWPASLDALVPNYLPTIPIDDQSGRPLGYALRGDGSFSLWAVGFDRDDDGGQPAVNPHNWAPRDQALSQAAADPRLDGDLVFWPPLPDEPQ